MLNAIDIASIQATIASALDVSLPLERNTPGVDTSGHATESWASRGSIACNVKAATASMLQLYAEIIGSQRAIVLRVMSSVDVRQGDRVTYDGRKWLVHEVINAQSYTWANEYLAVSIV